MLKNNKGFSFIEMVIVIAIMAILAGLSTLTFASVNRARSDRMMDNFKTYAKYCKTLTKSNSKDTCMALMKADDDSYYVIYGVASGDSMADLRSSFQSMNIQVVSADGKQKQVNQAGYSLAELESEPTKAAEYNELGNNKITIKYNGTAIEQGAQNAIIIQFRKFDGSVKVGFGNYSFSKTRRPNEIKCETTLEELTGEFPSNKQTNSSGNAAG
jgi:prepilin-type N-terminal cleavage/methylation domain-containing protein